MSFNYWKELFFISKLLKRVIFFISIYVSELFKKHFTPHFDSGFTFEEKKKKKPLNVYIDYIHQIKFVFIFSMSYRFLS